MTEQEKKYALVTGCTPGGIGHYLALEFSERGYHVLATVRDPSKYTPPPHPLITYLPLELTSSTSIAALRTRVAEITSSRLHILYNNAGRNYTTPAVHIEADELEDLFHANVFSVMKMCAAFTPLLVETRGTIVQTGSLAGLMPYVWGSAYGASKAALHCYSDTLRVELAPLGVRVLNVVTGGVKSNIARVDRSLPPDSYYAPLSGEYARRLKHSQNLGMDTRAYARDCVRQVVGGDGWFVKKRWIWEGRLSWVVWFVYSYLPRWSFDWWFSWNFKLGRLKGTVGPDKKNV